MLQADGATDTVMVTYHFSKIKNRTARGTVSTMHYWVVLLAKQTAVKVRQDASGAYMERTHYFSGRHRIQ